MDENVNRITINTEIIFQCCLSNKAIKDIDWTFIVVNNENSDLPTVTFSMTRVRRVTSVFNVYLLIVGLRANIRYSDSK